jgi:dUTP pyrophosphatase
MRNRGQIYRMKVLFKKLTSTAVIPTYAHFRDAGADIYSDETYALVPGERKLFKTGIAAAIDTGYEGQIRSRSGNALKRGLIVLNSPGTVDAGYRGEWGVILYNAGNEAVTIYQGDRIAQVVFNKIEHPSVWPVDELPSSDDERNEAGYGSSGQ